MNSLDRECDLFEDFEGEEAGEKCACRFRGFTVQDKRW
jgi:hypothetical protein